jgi:hypothetical protein
MHYPKAGDPVGSVNRFAHVHLGLGPRAGEVNLLCFSLPEFGDHVRPTIPANGVWLMDESGVRLSPRRGRIDVAGRLAIVVEAWDQVDRNERRRRLGVYSLGYQVLDGRGHPVEGFEEPRMTVQFDRLPQAPGAGRLAYAEGSGQYVSLLEGQIAGGVHRFTVIAKDSAGNLSRKSFDFTIVGGAPIGFLDMKTHWAAGYVSFLAGSGVLTGVQTKDGMVFNPEKNITRLEMAAMLSRYLGLDPKNYEDVSLPYADLSKIESWGLGYAKALYAEGIMKGREKDGKLYFDPDANITREEAVTTLGRTCEMGYAVVPISVKDKANIAPYAKPYLDLFVTMGVLTGYSDGTIRPKNNIKRSEAAAILYKLY